MQTTYRDRGWRVVLTLVSGIALVGGFVGTVVSRGTQEIKDQPVGAAIYGSFFLLFVITLVRVPWSGVRLDSDELVATTPIRTHRVARSSITAVGLRPARGPTGALRLVLELDEGDTRSIGLLGRYSFRRGAEEMLSGIEAWLDPPGVEDQGRP